MSPAASRPKYGNGYGETRDPCDTVDVMQSAKL